MPEGVVMTSRPYTPETRAVPMEIPLTQGFVALVDPEDYDVLSKCKWHAAKNGNTVYAKRGLNSKTIFMHRAVIECKTGDEIDHIDGNGLNNQKSNLRVASPRVNQQNQHVNKKSGYTGVYRTKYGRFKAFIQIKGKTRYIGYFFNEVDAHNRYLAFARAADAYRVHPIGGCCDD
jgi:hypothetical protein